MIISRREEGLNDSKEIIRKHHLLRQISSHAETDHVLILRCSRRSPIFRGFKGISSEGMSLCHPCTTPWAIGLSAKGLYCLESSLFAGNSQTSNHKLLFISFISPSSQRKTFSHQERRL